MKYWQRLCTDFLWREKVRTCAMISSVILNIISKMCESLQKEYLSGKKGKTAQYWMSYMSLVNLQQQLHYSINTNNFYTRLECYKNIVASCFSTNKVNYARYGRYYVKLLENLSQPHPGAAEELMKKGLSVRRNESGIGQLIDGAGEQTFL